MWKNLYPLIYSPLFSLSLCHSSSLPSKNTYISLFIDIVRLKMHKINWWLRFSMLLLLKMTFQTGFSSAFCELLLKVWKDRKKATVARLSEVNAMSDNIAHPISPYFEGKNHSLRARDGLEWLKNQLEVKASGGRKIDQYKRSNRSI